MIYYPIGELIREYRLRQGLTQEQLCEGICTPATLSKIENAFQTPGRRVSEALLERLGVNNVMQFALLGEMDLQNFMLEEEIKNLVFNGNEEELWGKITKYQQEADWKNMLERQFVLWCRALYEEKRGVRPTEAKQYFVEALQCTIKDFSGIGELKNRLYTVIELSIIYNICCYEYCLGNEAEAWNGVEQILKYIEKRRMEHSCGKLYPSVLRTLAKWDSAYHRPQASAQKCEKALRYNLEPGLLVDLQELTTMLSKDYEAMGRFGLAGTYGEFADVIQKVQVYL